MKKMHYIIGAGGGGSWLTPAMCLLVGKENVTVIDGDALEAKNLNRQLYDESFIGENKAQSMNTKYGCAYMTDYYTFGAIQHQVDDWIFSCADNNPARLAILRACDHFGCSAIIAGNETTSSESYVYLPQWQGTQLDPRTYYPTIGTDSNFDPLRPESCTGEYQKQNPQLVSANFSAVALAMNLYVLWGMKSSTITRDILSRMPFKYNANISRLESHHIGDKLQRKPKVERTDNEQNRNITASGASVR